MNWKKNFSREGTTSLKRKAFTLVELIIVITILAILATIAFVSFQGYTRQSRDANRVSTVKNIENGIEIFFTKSGTLPSPDIVTGTGNIWGVSLSKVWSIGDSITRQINLNTPPKDPLYQTAYMYGTDAGNRYYQIWVSLESQTALFPWISPTYADTQTQAKVSWSYEWLLKYNGMIYNLPSLLYTGSGNLLSGQTYFIVDKGQNIPNSTENSLTGAEIFKLVWSTATSITGITLPSDLNSYKANYLTYANSLWYGVDSIGVALYGKEYTTTQTTCAPWIEEISLWNGQIWSCKNLWATTVRDGTSLFSCISSTDCSNKTLWAWDYYQWGRNDTWWTNWDGSYADWRPAQWLWADANLWGWSGTTSASWTWSSSTPTNQFLMQWPCLSWWHVPTDYEWKIACDTISWTNCMSNSATVKLIQSKLKLPIAWYRAWNDGHYYEQPATALYWSSTPTLTDALPIVFNNAMITYANLRNRANGFSVRCIKN